MACLGVLIALFMPRFVLVMLWLFTNYLNRAFDAFIWPFLGFVFLPTTTIAYAIAENRYGGADGWGLVIVLLGFSLDIGLWGSGRGYRAKKFRR
jgi:hypothetical protein